MSEDAVEPASRSIDLSIEVPGTPEEVWRAIATGPGITSWYVPHEIEEREGGTGNASFGPEPEMQAPGRVAAWEPPKRLVLDSGEEGSGLAFEWLVEAKDGGTCVVRLINSGFGSGEPWDDHYDGMLEGWATFLHNLEVHLQHFPGQSATALLPMAMWEGTRSATWDALTTKLGVDAHPKVGQQLAVSAAGAPMLVGTVTDTTPHRVSMLLDAPASGTGFIAVEGAGTQMSVSVWLYLYGIDTTEAGAEIDAQWRAWLADNAT